MNALNVPRPAWMSEDVVLLEEQARRFIADEFVPHLDRWHEAGIYDRDVWTKAGAAGAALRGHAGKIWRRRRQFCP
jgi:acyl-CoA dehydrogenase